jgi:hypothetical protein
MHHVAIMNKSWKLIPKILNGQKTIESRWYQTRRTPWDRIFPTDTVYFKNAGESITATAKVEKVLQFILKDIADAEKIVTKYGKKICIVNPDPRTWGKLPKYCILIFLKEPKQIKPFNIDKTGFGNAAAWLIIKNIQTIKS